MYIEDEYSNVFQWLSNGEKIQVDVDRWTVCSTEGVLRHILNGIQPGRFRLAPKKILVNGVEVPAPESVPPKLEQHFFCPTVDTEAMWWTDYWANTKEDQLRLERGLVYLNKEDAIARAEAMLITKEV